MNSKEVIYRSRLSETEWDCFIPSVLSLPTGVGGDKAIVSLSDVRDHMGFPGQYRAGIAKLTGPNGSFVVGPPPDQIPACLSDLYWYMSLAGDRHVKGWYATIFLLSVHPWDDGNGRTGREFYRRYTGSCESRDSLRGRLREALSALQPPRRHHKS